MQNAQEHTTKLLDSEKIIHDGASGILTSAKHVYVLPCLVVLIGNSKSLKLIQLCYFTPQNDDKHTTKLLESEKTIHDGASGILGSATVGTAKLVQSQQQQEVGY